MNPEDEELLAAVTEPGRRRLLDVLLALGEATPTALAAELPFTRQAVAKHLAVLDRAGLVEARRDGREVRYSVRPERLDAAVRAMADVAARWDARLQRIKQIAEAAHRETRSGEAARATRRP
ncbi:ArsR/SmtB family transcription factor [Nonomuraea sp. 10N515B]|uniref:ArsR/SmtB family transcription factor n=1 Tax=Nonomuraea sp. 10N515B TaxID=3457422 RepID=UPI003FCE49AE